MLCSAWGDCHPQQCITLTRALRRPAKLELKDDEPFPWAFCRSFVFYNTGRKVRGSQHKEITDVSGDGGEHIVGHSHDPCTGSRQTPVQGHRQGGPQNPPWPAGAGQAACVGCIGCCSENTRQEKGAGRERQVPFDLRTDQGVDCNSCVNKEFFFFPLQIITSQFVFLKL